MAKIECPGITISKIMEIILELQLKNVIKEESGYYGLSSRLSYEIEA